MASALLVAEGMIRCARLVGAMLFGVTVALATADASAQQSPPCPAREIEYALTGTLWLTDTPFNLGNGAHKVGPGTVVLRFEPDGHVSILSYAMRQAFTIEVSAFFARVVVHANSTTRATPNACGIAGEGILKDRTLAWTSNVRAVRTDGTVSCSGKYCGSHGVPEIGPKPIQIGPADVRVRPFEFSADWRTFTMQYTLAAKTEVPKQTSFLALTGREVKRTCVPRPTPCR